MVVLVDAPPFRRKALWVAMETMHFNIARIRFFLLRQFLLPVFGDFSSFFICYHPEKIPFPSEFLGLFSMKQDTFLILKLLTTFLKELVVGQGSFTAKCTGLLAGVRKHVSLS